MRGSSRAEQGRSRLSKGPVVQILKEGVGDSIVRHKLPHRSLKLKSLSTNLMDAVLSNKQGRKKH